MFIEFTTTITHKVELRDGEGIVGVTHAAEIGADDEAAAMGSHVLTRIAEAGARATLRAFEKGRVAEDDEGDE